MGAASTPLRILVNMPSQYGGRPSGVARVIFRLLEALIDSTPHHYILRSPWRRGQLPVALRESRLDVMETPRPSIMLLDVLRQAVFLPALCRRHAVDLVLNADPFGAPLGGLHRVTVVHDLYFKAIPERTGRRAALTTGLIFRLMTAGSARLVCVSEATRGDLTRWYPRTGGKSLAVHWAGTLVSGLADIAPPLVRGRYILSVGNATPNKNLALMARAFMAIASEQPDLRLVHVGRNADKDILGAIPNEAMRSRVVRFEDIDDGQLAALYSHAACLCIPSVCEGFCLPVLEAQTFGCPVICSDRSALPEIAGKGALTFDPENVDKILSALRHVLSEAGLAERLRALGYENARRFSWSRTAEAYAALFDDLMSRR